MNTRRNAVAAADKVEDQVDNRVVDQAAVDHGAAAGRDHIRVRTRVRLNRVNIAVRTTVHRGIVMKHARINLRLRERRPTHRHVMIVLRRVLAIRNINVGVHHAVTVSNKAMHLHRTVNKKVGTMAAMADVMMVAAANHERRNNISHA